MTRCLELAQLPGLRRRGKALFFKGSLFLREPRVEVRPERILLRLDRRICLVPKLLLLLGEGLELLLGIKDGLIPGAELLVCLLLYLRNELVLCSLDNGLPARNELLLVVEQPENDQPDKDENRKNRNVAYDGEKRSATFGRVRKGLGRNLDPALGEHVFDVAGDLCPFLRADSIILFPGCLNGTFGILKSEIVKCKRLAIEPRQRHCLPGRHR